MGRHELRCVMVSHTHWDREWYRTFESFRGRLVDAVDRVLDLLADDPGWCVIVRVLNPTNDPLEAHLRVAWQPSSATAVRLDETPTEDDVRMSGGTVAFDVPAHALRAVHLR